ncbi:hypothetical protein [uncultured Kordia sp.]|uniref:hypothetical protein n=1 Tax=uncultured Kordia sp. TaxID=507699 RepID=UPI00262AE8E8|nr:hypothetical protein [uncultured Kordia sp.]
MKTVIVEITTEDLIQLKDAKYNLCFAKKLNDSFNVVWQSYDNFLNTNHFSYEPNYELFCSNTFEENELVVVSTNIQPCDLGNYCTLTEAGVLDPQTSGGINNSLTLKNDYDTIHSGVQQSSTGIDGKTISTPIYVSEKAIIKGYDELNPKDIVRVWFQQDIETSTMILPPPFQQRLASSYYIDVDLTSTNEVTCVFENGDWKTS